MKKTAVEWLRKELQTIPDYSFFYTRNYQWIDSIMNEAKEMEKQKLEQFYNHGQWAIIENGHGECFEDYYNRIFKSE